MVALGRADLAAALAASPLATLGAPLWVLWPRIAPTFGRLRAAAGRRLVPLIVVAVALVSELWQLHRAFG